MMRVALTLIFLAALPAAAEPDVSAFFENHCYECHGPDKSKGGITLHTIDLDIAGGGDQELWEKILDMLENGEMPPEDQPQPDEDARQAVAKWIKGELKAHVNSVSWPSR